MATPSGTNSERELDARLLRFRTQAATEDVLSLIGDLLTAHRAHDALELILTARREAPGDVRIHVLEGRAHYVGGDFLRAQATLLDAAQIAPANKEPFRWLGEVLLKRGDPERALKVLERARALDETDSTIVALHARAERLSRIARSEGMPDSVPPDASPAVDEERTVVAAPSEATRLSLHPTTRPPPPLAEPVVDVSLDTSWSEEPTRSVAAEALLESADTLAEHTRGSAEELAPPEHVAEHEAPIQEQIPLATKPKRRGLLRTSALLVLLTIAGALGVYLFLEHRHRRATELASQALTEARHGDDARLVLAERHLEEARVLDPEIAARSNALFFVIGRRALDHGTVDLDALARALETAQRASADSHWIHAIRALMSAASGDHEAAERNIEQALSDDPADPELLYVVGRLEQQLANEDARRHLEQALEQEPRLSAAVIALAETRCDEGQTADAGALLAGLIAHDEGNLRARLWTAFLGAMERPPAEALAELDLVEEQVEHSAPKDHVLAHITRAILLHRQGDAGGSHRALDAAVRTEVQEPRLLEMIARAAMDVGRLEDAERAARSALQALPSRTEFRHLLASIQLSRGEGEAALATLRGLSPSDPDTLSMLGRASLLVGTAAASNDALGALDAHLATHEDAELELHALRIRLSFSSTPADQTLAAARELERAHPGDPITAAILGEAALRAGDSRTAISALTTVVEANPRNADGHHLLGQAYHQAGNGEAAKRSLEQALRLQPESRDIRRTLGRVLRDLGDYEAAHHVCEDLDPSCRIESLIGLGRLEEARTALDALGAHREESWARMLAARLALSEGRSADAVAEIRAIFAAEGGAEPRSAELLAFHGDALLAAGDINASAAAFEEALARDPQLPEALIGRAELLIRGDHPRDGAPLLERAGRVLRARIRPPSVHARKLMLEGRVAFLTHDLPTARTRLREATALPGVPAEAYFHLGEALSRDNAPEARAAYARYLELAPSGFFAQRARRAIRGR